MFAPASYRELAFLALQKSVLEPLHLCKCMVNPQVLCSNICICVLHWVHAVIQNCSSSNLICSLLWVSSTVDVVQSS